MIDPTEKLMLIRWLVVQILFLGIGWIQHFNMPSEHFKRLSAPRWLRVMFGDLRKSGTLEIRAAIIQILAVLAVLSAYGIAWYGDFTLEYAKWIVFTQWGTAALLITLSRFVLK